MDAQEQKRLLEAAREKIKQQKLAEEQFEIAAYEGLLLSKKWRNFKYLAYICALFSLILTADIVLPGKTEKLPFNQIEFWHGFLRIDGAWFMPERGALQKFQEETFTQEKSAVFGVTKTVCWKSEDWQYDVNAPKIYSHYCTGRRNSIYSYFPGVNVLFLIPLTVVLLKRRKPWFVFMRYVCWLLIYPASLWVLISMLV